MKACITNASPCLSFLQTVIRPFPLAQESQADLVFLFVAFKFALVHIAARIRNLLRDKDSFASQYCFQSLLAPKISGQKTHMYCCFSFCKSQISSSSVSQEPFFPEWTLCSLVILISSGILGLNNLFCNMKMSYF